MDLPERGEEPRRPRSAGLPGVPPGRAHSSPLRGGGTFVLNKQTPNRQVWLSSPVTGPQRYNFCLRSAMWRNARDDDVELTALLADDLEQLLGTRLSFEQVEADLREALDGGS